MNKNEQRAFNAALILKEFCEHQVCCGCIFNGDDDEALGECKLLEREPENWWLRVPENDR